MTESSDRNNDQGYSEATQDSFQKDQFIYAQSRYRGDFTPENLAFNSNLQEFAQRVAIICNLETNGKIPSQDAYDQIKKLWKQLKQSKNEFLDTPPPSPPPSSP